MKGRERRRGNGERRREGEKKREKKACDTEMRRRQILYGRPAITIIFPPPFVPCQTEATGTSTGNLKVHAGFEIRA